MRYLILLICLPLLATAQNTFSKSGGQPENKTGSQVVDINENVKGTLLIPDINNQVPLVILLTGSGPNDRDGNSSMTKNDSHKQLANALNQSDIATYRYDKRTVTWIKQRKDAGSIRLTDFVTDAQSIIEHFKDDDRFSKIFLAGHSQGSLVAMLAASPEVDGFISIAGAADPIDQIIVQQVGAQAPGLDKQVSELFEKMKNQDSLVKDVPPYLMSIFNPGVQPFMKEWIQYDPKEILATMEMPTLIINGDQDTQVDTVQADKLASALPDAQVVIIKGMNHVLKEVNEDPLEAAKSYVDPNFPLHPELVAVISDFVKQ
jgi:pimeloyl-ACP methyl ester carboxylesterase